MITKKKKAKPAVSWVLDAGFYSVEVRVTARTKGEARSKAMAKLAKMSPKGFLCKESTFLSKED